MLSGTKNLVVVSNRVLHVLTYVNNPCRFAKLYTICWNMIEQLLFYQCCTHESHDHVNSVLTRFFYSLWYFYARTLYNVWYVHWIVVECTSRYILFSMVNCHLYARYVKYWLAVLWIEIMNSPAWFQANVNCFSLKESDICFWKKRRHNILRGSCILLLKNNMNAYFITSRCPTFLRI